jgi:hypothetical protein
VGGGSFSSGAGKEGRSRGGHKRVKSTEFKSSVSGDYDDLLHPYVAGGLFEPWRMEQYLDSLAMSVVHCTASAPASAIVSVK